MMLMLHDFPIVLDVIVDIVLLLKAISMSAFSSSDKPSCSLICK